jgi:hypothetical protein
MKYLLFLLLLVTACDEVKVDMCIPETMDSMSGDSMAVDMSGDSSAVDSSSDVSPLQD